MSDTEILEKAIQKAVDGGWPALNIGGAEYWNGLTRDKKRYHVENMVVMGSAVASQSYPITIFNHDFAKALWGEEKMDVVVGEAYPDEDDEDVYSIPWNIYEKFVPWEYHLSRMVIADDPIKYLGENL